MTGGSRLPRSAWLALGAVGGGLVLSADDRFGLIAIAVALGMAPAAVAVRLVRPNSSAIRAGTAAILGASFGATLVIARAALLPGTSAVAGVTAGSSGPRIAVVESVGSPKGTEQIAQIRLGDDPAQPGSGALVEALLPRFPEIGPGDRISVEGSVRPPGPDEYGAYLRRLGAAGSLRSPTLVIIAGPTGPRGWIDAVRRTAADALGRALPEPEAGLADGILIGLRERVDRDLAAAFTTAGVSHIVAISGWNIAIVAALVSALLAGRVGIRPRTTITLVAIVGYTVVAGASPSVNRAAVMAAIGLTARATGRSSSALAALGWAVLLLLVLDPGAVTDPGFALSGTATAGLIAWSPPLAERLRRARFGKGEAGVLPGWLAESLAISLTAEAATLPIVLLTFGRLAIVAPLANLATVPLVPPAMAAGAIALGAGGLGMLGLPAPIVTALGLPAWAVLGLLVALVRLAASLPFASLSLPAPWNVVAAVVVATGLGLLVAGRRAIAVLQPGPVPTS